MRSKSKIFLIIFVLAVASVAVSVSLGYYLMSTVPILAKASESNPFEALRKAGKVMINGMVQTAFKKFILKDADLDYNQTVDFSEDKFELKTAEQIIGWNAFHSNQPWIDMLAGFSQRQTTPLPIQLYILCLSNVRTETIQF